MILPIHVYGDEGLREPTVPVPEMTDELRTLAANMIETMRGADGVGLAAPQVGRPERIFVADLTAFAARGPGGDGSPEPLPPQPMVFVNPEIVWESDEEVSFEEGCLSIPDVRETVWRPERIRLRWRDEHFAEQEGELAGMLARVAQHEIDHLEGILFVDHLTAFRRRMLQRRLREMAKGNVEADYPIRLPE